MEYVIVALLAFTGAMMWIGVADYMELNFFYKICGAWFIGGCVGHWW